jgi:hypothetical protein
MSTLGQKLTLRRLIKARPLSTMSGNYRRAAELAQRGLVFKLAFAPAD